MKTLTRIFLIALIPLLLAACEPSKEKPEGVIPQGYKDALKKAENVEGVLLGAEQKQKEAMEAANL
jgi:hypothetical protein